MTVVTTIAEASFYVNQSHGVRAPVVAGAPVEVPDLSDQLALLERAAVTGGLRGASGDEALGLIAAAEAVKGWAESIAVAAAATLTRKLESDRSSQDPRDRTKLGYLRFVRECRSVAAWEIQVATGLPITQCQSLVWFAACEDERTATVRALMRQGALSYRRALDLVERTQHLDAVAADRIAGRVLAPSRHRVERSCPVKRLFRRPRSIGACVGSWGCITVCWARPSARTSRPCANVTVGGSRTLWGRASSWSSEMARGLPQQACAWIA
jgi:hypothetical protein